jgi:hypothetical protein
MLDLFQNFWFLVFAFLVIVSVVGTVTQAWQKVRRADREAALKEAMIQRGLSVEEMERLLRAGSKAPEESAYNATDDDAIEELSEKLAESHASAPTVEEVMTGLRDADSSTRQTICRAVKAVINGAEGGDPIDPLILAVVRGLCRPAAAPAEPGPSRQPDLAIREPIPR